MNKKRNRQILVCANCHKKKRKCDKEVPCSSCIKLSIESTCSYSSLSRKRQHVMDDELCATQEFSKQNSRETTDELTESINDEHREDLSDRIETLNRKVKELETVLTTSALGNNPNSIPINYIEGRDTFMQELRNSSKSVCLNREANRGLIGFNPVQLDERKFNFLNTFNTSSNVPVSPYGPLRYLILIKQDPAGVLLTSYFKSPSSKNFEHFSSPHIADLEKLDEKSRHFYADSYIKEVGKDCTMADIIEVKDAISKFGLTLGLSFNTAAQLENENSLLDKIKFILPNNNALNLLLNLFFEILYPHFPILDEASFRSDILRIFGEELNDSQRNRIETIKIRNRHDIAVVVTLLILIRLSYLSLFNNDVRKNENMLNSQNYSLYIRNKKYLLENPIPIETIDIAKLCIRELDLISLPNLAIFQASLMMQIYQTYAPEENTFTRTESPVSIGNLYQMANSLFLNRDPDYILYYADRRMEEKVKILSRRLWYFLTILDIEDSILYGTQIYTVQSNYDTKIPSVPRNSPDRHMGIETEIVTAIEALQPVIKSAHGYLERIFRVNSDMTISELAKYLSGFEILVQENLGTLNDYLNTDMTVPKFLKIQKFKLYLYCKIMLLSTYYCLFLYYEVNKNLLLSLFYLKKLIQTIGSELAGISRSLMDNCDEYFGPAFTLILSPILQIFSRMELLTFLIQMRVKCTQKSLEKKFLARVMSKETLKLYDKTLENLLSVFSSLMNSNRNFMSLFKTRYYFAWKYTQSIIYGLNIVADDNLYADEEKTENASLKYSLHDICELENLLTSCVNSKEKDSSCPKNDISTFSRYRKIDKDSIGNQEDAGSIRDLMHDIQVDKLWRLLDFFKEESYGRHFRGIWSKFEKSETNRDSFPGNLSLENSNVIANTEIDVMLQESDPFREFGIEDFFFDNEFYNRLSHLH